MKTIAIQVNKGGVGKTTLVTNLAGVLSKEGKKVLIVDTDQQGNAPLQFNKQPESFENTLLELLLDEIDVKDGIYNLHQNIDILPSNTDLTFYELELEKRGISRAHITKQFAKIISYAKRSKYDFVIFDTTPTFTSLSANVINVVDEIYTPAVPEVNSFKSIVTLYKHLKRDGQEAKLKAIIPLKVKGRTKVHKEILDVINENAEKMGVFVTSYITDSIKHGETIFTEALPLVLSKTRYANKSIYKTIATELNLIGGK